MSKPIPKKKSGFSPKASVSKKRPIAKAKGKKKLPAAKPRELRERGWMVAGFDTSMSALSGAAIGYDRTLKKLRGPVFVNRRWDTKTHYFDRLKDASKSPDLIHELLRELKLQLNIDEVFIAQEEPWPFGLAGKGVSAFLKQQAEISGAFLGGLVRYGYQNVSQINSIRWRTMIANELEITTHHSKWRSPELAAQYNCAIQDSGKFRAKQWALNPGYAFMGIFPNEIPNWPDVIKSKLGNLPRPEDSKARAIQPDDRYDALAIMWAHFTELNDEGQLKTGSG